MWTDIESLAQRKAALIWQELVTLAGELEVDDPAAAVLPASAIQALILMSGSPDAVSCPKAVIAPG